MVKSSATTVTTNKATAKQHEGAGRMMAAALMVVLMMSLAGGLLAQGAFNFAYPIAPNSTTGYSPGAGASWEITNNDAEALNIYRVGTALGSSSTTLMRTVQVSTRLGGAFSVSPPTATSHLITTGWVSHGTTQMLFTNTTAIFQIPININVTVASGQKLGIAIVVQDVTTPSATISQRLLTTPTLTDPSIRSDGRISIECKSVMGASNTVVGGPRHAATSASWGVYTQVWYDYAAYTGGPHASVMAGTIALSTPSPVIGSNTLRASILNIGQLALDNVSLPMQYSTDGGTNWSPIQSFSFPTFASLTTQLVEFTNTPWVISTAGTYDVRVRFNPAVGSGFAQAIRVFARDADLTNVVLVPQSAQIGIPVDVAVTVANNGDFTLENIPLNLRYSLDGSTWVTETFLPSVGQLAAKNTTHTFTFTQKLTVPTVGNYTLRAEFASQVSGDPDTTDAITRTLTNFGQTSFEVTAPQLPGQATSTGVPYNYVVGKMMATWSPDQLNYIAGEITGMSLWAISGAQTVGREYQNVKIWLGETTSVSGTSGVHYSTTFLTNFNVPSRPQTLVYDGPITYVAGPNLGYLWDNVKFTTGFNYSGLNNLAVYAEYTALSTYVSYSRLYYNSPLNSNFFLYTGNTVGTALGTTGTYTGNIAHAIKVQYEPALFGSHVKISSLGVNNNALLTSGMNSPTVTIHNVGSTDLSSTVVAAEYSLDGGTNWVPTSIPAGTFTPGSRVTHVLTPAWNLAGVGTYTLMARLVAPTPIATGHGPVTKVYRPDADIASAVAAPRLPLVGVPTEVKVTVRNSGDFSLVGVPLNLRYSFDNVNWTSQIFTPSAGQLEARDSTFEFTFTQQATLTSPGSYTLRVNFATQVVGDPDASDATTLNIPNVGSNEHVIAPPFIVGGTLTSTTTGFSTVGGAVFMTWSPAELNYLAGEITGMSLWELGASFTGTKTWNNVKIWLGETTSTAGVVTTNYSTTFLTNFNVPSAPQVLVYDGVPAPMTNGVTGQFVFNNLQFTTGYRYSGQNRLAVYMQYTATSATPAPSVRYYQYGGSGNFKLYATTATNTLGTYAGLDLVHTARIQYEPILPGNNVKVTSVGLAGNALMATGNNTAVVTIRNVGSTNLSSTVIAAEYSTDGGTVWTPTIIPAPAFDSMQSITHTLTTTWNVASVSAQSLKVRLVAPTPLAPLEGIVTKEFTPDLDLEAVTTLPTPVTYNTPTTVSVTARNNGNWDLSTLSQSLSFTTNGVNQTSQSFTLTSLTTTSSTQILTFTPQLTVTDRGTLTLRVSPTTPVSGDPDSLDEATLLLPDVGLTVADTPLGTTSASGTPIYALTTTGYDSVNVSIYTPAELPALLTANSEIRSLKFYKANAGGTEPSVTNAILRVWLMNTTADGFTAAPLFSTVTTGATLVADHVGFQIPNTPAGWVEMGPFNTNTPFIYTGGNLQVVTQYSVHQAASPFHTATLQWRRILIPTTPARIPGALGVSTVGMVGGNSLSFQLSANTHVADMQLGFLAPTVTDLDVASVTFNSPAVTRPSIGSNSINVTVRCMGSGGFTGTYSLRYSTTNGVSWSTPQVVTATGLVGSSTTQTVTLAAPWVIGGLGAQSLRVQIEPVVTGDPDVIDEFAAVYRPDVDVDLVEFGAVPQLNQVAPIRARVKNNGSLNLVSPMSLSMRYRIGQGAWVAETFTAATGLTNNGSTAVVTFTQGHTFTTSGTYAVTVEIVPTVTGDPDGTDSMTRSFDEVGVPQVFFNPTPFQSSSSSPPINRVSSTSTTHWSAHQILYTAANLAPLAPNVYLSSIGFYKETTFGSTPTAPNTNLKVWLRNSTLTTYTTSETLASCQAGSVLVVDRSDFYMPNTVGWVDFGPFNTPNLFFYTGGSLEILVEWDCAAGTTPWTEGAFSWRTFPYPGSATDSMARGTTSTAVIPATTTLFTTNSTSQARQPWVKVGFEVPVAVDLDVDQISFGTGAANSPIPQAGANNVVTVRIRSKGTTAYTGNYFLQWSDDNGANWSTAQSFTATALTGINTTETVSMSANWNIPTVAAKTLKVRIFPPVSGDPDTTDELAASYAPDLDVAAVDFVSPPTLGTASYITARIRSNGSLRFPASFPLPLRYRIGTGAWVTQTFVSTGLFGSGSEESFTFTQEHVFMVAGAYDVRVEIDPTFAGDPDTVDSFTRSYPTVGIPSLSFTNSPPILTNSTVGSSTTGGVFELQAGPNSAITIHTVAMPASLQGTWMVSVSTRIGGAFTVYPPTAAANLITTGWTNFGPVPITFSATDVISPYAMVEIPIYLGITLQPGQILGVSITHSAGTFRYNGTQPTTPVAETNAHLSIRYAGMYNGGVNTVAGSPLIGGSTIIRGATTNVVYSIPPITGTNVGVESVRVNSGTGLVVGPNTIQAVIGNVGTIAYDGLPVNAEYSIDGGTSWIGTQTFTYPSFPSRSVQFANFTTPWTISTQAAQELRVRVIPPTTIGSANASITSTFTPDADITAISLNPVTPLPGVPNNVRATVTNNGGFNLTGQSMQLQYRVTLGTGAPGQWFTQSFPATDLSQGRSMTFEFTTNPLTFFSEGPYTIEVGFSTQVAGDTDTNDTFSRVYTDIGLTVATLATQALGTPNTAGNNFPMNWVTGGWFSSWSPTQMGNATGYISQFGLQYFSAFTAKTYGNVKIWVGETSNTTTTANTDFMANFNAGNPAVLAYDSALTISNPIADGFARIQLQNGYIYSGLNNIGVYIQITGGSAAPSSPVRTYPAGAANIRVYNDTAVGPTGIVNNIATGAVFVFEPVYNPGLVVERVGGGRVQPQGNDGLGISVTAANPSVVNYLLKNRSQTTNLTISNISVSNPINCVASISGTSPTTVAFGGVGVPLAFNLTAGPGAYSFDVTIVSNNAQPGANPFVFTVSGTGFVNTAPVALTPVSGGVRTLLISEVSSDQSTLPSTGDEYFEVTNVGATPVDMAGWRIFVYEGATTVPYTGYPVTLPSTVGVVPPGGVFTFVDLGTPIQPGYTMAANILWNTGASGGVVLVDASNNIVDAMFFGAIDPSLVTIPIPGGPVLSVGTEWLGPASALTPIFQFSMVRTGVLDNNDATDWTQAAGHSIGQLNAGLIVPFGGGDLQISGTAPNYIVETFVGATLTLAIMGDDVDTHQDLTVVINEATGGTLTAAQAGFTNTFPLNSGPGKPIRSAALLGTAALPGIAKFTATVTDNGVFPLFSTINIEFRIGARVDVNTMDADSMFVRVNGRKDFYRGQTNQPVELTITSNNPMPVHLSALNFALKEKVSGDPVTGVTFTLPSNPVVIPANATNHPVIVSMDIGASASGANGVACELLLSSGTAFNPLAPTDVFVVKIAPAGQVDEFDLYDGPAPQPMVITLAAFNPAVISVGFTQNLTVSGGSGSYTWSVDPSSASQLPDGLVVNPTGSQFLPATISGTPTALATIGNYVITLRVTDGAYVDTKTLTMTVAALTQLVFTPITLAPGMEFVPYTMTTPFSATGGSLIYTYSVDSSSTDQLPLGLSLNPQTGVISGTPADGTQNAYSITFALDDGLSTLTQTLTLTIAPNVLQWRGTTLPTATQTVAYNEALDAIGGTGPRIYTIVSGTLPNGLSLTAATGIISGVPSLTPPSAGTYNLVFKVTDGVNANVNQAITITVVPAAPLVVTTANLLDYAEVGQPYSTSIISTGGSQSYTFTVSNSGPALPAGLTLAPSGALTGTPGIGTDGRYDIVISVNDGFQTIAKTLTLAVLAQSADSFGISEVDTGTGYIELANDSTNVIDVSGWSLRVWVDGNSPINLPFDSIPGASLALPGEVVMITIGGTAGGFWPTYSTGGSWTASGTSNIAVQLLDIFGNTVDFAAFGTVNRSALQDGANNAIELPGDLGTDPNSSNGSANYSFTGSGWTGAATGTPGVLNAGTQAFPLAILKDEIRTAVAGESFFDFTLAIGGTKPYTYSLVAPGATWLSLGATSGVFSGTVPAVTSVTTVNIDVTVTDANTVAVTETFTLNLAPATHAASGTFTVANAEGQSFEGTVIDVPVTFTRANGVTDVSGFAFIIDLPTTTAAELDVIRVIAGPAAMAAGRGIVARDMGNNRLFIGDTDGLGNATPLGDGVVAIIRFMVPMDDSVMAPEATYGVTISNIAITRDAPGVYTAAGVSGSMILSNYKPQDVNRDNAIDVVDVQFTVNLILALQSPTYAGQGDANQDNAVDVVDVQTIVNCILFGGC